MTTHELLEKMKAEEWYRFTRPDVDIANRLFKKGLLHGRKIKIETAGRRPIEYQLANAGLLRRDYLRTNGCTQETCVKCKGKRSRRKPIVDSESVVGSTVADDETTTTEES